MSTDQGTLVRVTKEHIERGEAGNCERCAIALALQEATGDEYASVYDNWLYYFQVHGLDIEAPRRAVAFIKAFDSLERDVDGEAALEDPDLAPFEFTLPPADSNEWQTCCRDCGEPCARGELDDEGLCEDCREPDDGESDDGESDDGDDHES